MYPELSAKELKDIVKQEWETLHLTNPLPSRIFLTRDFYRQDTFKVAQELLGKVIEHVTPAGTIAVIINEVEAYTMDDPSNIAHKDRKLTPRVLGMYTDGGTFFLYKSMGIHIMWNIITESPKEGNGVLIRGCVQLRGTEHLLDIQKAKSVLNALDGPGKLTKRLRIPMEYYGTNVGDEDSPLKIYDEGFAPVDVQNTVRINVGNDLPWRWICKKFTKNNEIYP